jgi:hypothetical protein
VLLRLVLSYCLGEWGLRSTAAWATAIGLADLSSATHSFDIDRLSTWQAEAASSTTASRISMST